MSTRVWIIFACMGWIALSAATAAAAAPEDRTVPLTAYDPTTLVFVANRDSNDVAVIDTKTDRVIGRITLGDVAAPHMAMVTNDGGKLLVSATGSDRFLVVDLATGKIEQSIQTGHAPEHFDLTPNDRFAYVGAIKGAAVSVIDIRAGKEVQRLAGFSEPHGFSVLPEASKVYVSNFGAHEVGVIEIPEQRLAARLAIGDAHRAAIRHPERYQSALKGVAHPTPTIDGRHVYAADGDAGVVGVIDTRTDRVTKTITVGAAPWRAYASPDGRWMLVPNNGDATVSVIRTQTQEVVATFAAGATITGINFAQGGRKAYIISQGESAVYIYDMQTLKPVERLKLGTGLALETGATTADGAKIYVASSTDNSVYVIDAATDRVKRIAGVGRFPWAVTILGAASPNYCH